MPPIRRSGARPVGPTGKRVVAGRAQRPTSDTTKAASAGDEAIDAVPDETASAVPDETTSADAAATGTAPAEATEDTSTASQETDAGADAGAPARPRRIRQVAAAAAVVVGVAAAVVGGLSLADHRSSPLPGVTDGNSAFVDTQRTEDVRRAATSAVQRLVSIDHQSLDEYHDTLGEYLSDELIAELDKSWPTLKQTYQDTKLRVDANVTDVGVSYLQDDRAEVLLVQDVSTTRDGVAAGSTTGTYLVTMSLIDGVWKLSKIPDLPS